VGSFDGKRARYNHSSPVPASGVSEFDLFENINLAGTVDPALVAELRAVLHAAFNLV
jgi:hypothetical protein